MPRPGKNPLCTNLKKILDAYKITPKALAEKIKGDGQEEVAAFSWISGVYYSAAGKVTPVRAEVLADAISKLAGRKIASARLLDPKPWKANEDESPPHKAGPTTSDDRDFIQLLLKTQDCKIPALVKMVTGTDDPSLAADIGNALADEGEIPEDFLAKAHARFGHVAPKPAVATESSTPVTSGIPTGLTMPKGFAPDVSGFPLTKLPDGSLEIQGPIPLSMEMSNHVLWELLHQEG